MTRRAIPAALAVAAALAAFAPAAFSVRRGTFGGQTSEGDTVGFKVDRGGRVHAFHFEDIRLSCRDGDEVRTPRVRTPRGMRFKVRRNRFGIEARNATTGFGWDAKGTFRRRGRRATGTLKAFASFTEDNQQSADGPIKCESAPLTWTVRRR